MHRDSFFKNITQIGLIAFVVMCSASLGSEIKNKTLIMLLSKGLSRKVVIFAKASMMILLFSIVYLLSILVTRLYCAYFWNGEQMPNLVLSLSMVWLFVVFLISIILLGSVLFTGRYGGLLFSGFIIVLLFIGGVFPVLQEGNPMLLITSNMQVIQGALLLADIWIPVTITLLGSVICIVATCIVFDRKTL